MLSHFFRKRDRNCDQETLRRVVILLLRAHPESQPEERPKGSHVRLVRPSTDVRELLIENALLHGRRFLVRGLVSEARAALCNLGVK